MTIRLPGTLEWLGSTHCAIHPFGWMDVNCSPRSRPNADRNDLSPKGCLSRDPKLDGRSINFESVKYTNLDRDGDSTCAHLREVSKDADAELNLVREEAMPACDSGECAEDQTRCFKVQEVAADVNDTDDAQDWREEQKQWIKAAGVRTPSDLQHKLEDLHSAASQNEADLKKFSSHFVEVKTFLLELHNIDQYLGRRKRRCQRLSRGRRRKRSRRRCAEMECYNCEISDHEESSSERASKQGREALLDPEIMRSFGSLIKSSPASQFSPPRILT